jgi:D-arabinose 1-dehydrogenase-like Zn-dependent alcohol dehydrogenase
MQGFGADGYFQEYTVVEARGAMVLPEGIDLVEAGLSTSPIDSPILD